MSGYTVTITPSGNKSGPKTTIQIDTTNGTARVTELAVRTGGNGLSAQEMPAIDLALLVAALAPGSVPAATGSATAGSAASARVRQPRGHRAPTAAKGTRGRVRTVAETPAKAKAKATRGRRRAAASAEAPNAARAYRRMPAQDDVVAAWNDSHSATALAAHFDVPRHTAQGWLRRLRAMGVIEPAS